MNGNVVDTLSRRPDDPDALICIDKARDLLEGPDFQLFSSLREALRNRFGYRRSDKPPILPKAVGDFFVTVLDTTFKFPNFWPLTDDDPSMAFVPPFDSRAQWLSLFPPIYAIDTMDVFAASDEMRFPDGSDDAVDHLVRYGRPLWGSRLEAGEEFEEICAFAKRIIAQGPNELRALALLSFRLNFNVANDTIAESLVLGLLRYCVYVRPDRDLMRITQPSESTLAFIASQKMYGAEARLNILQAFAQSSFEGSINIGMVAAMILLFAYDDAICRPGFAQFWIVQEAVPLARFMRALPSENAASELAKCMESDPEMGALLENGHIFANHFVRLNSIPDERTVRAAIASTTLDERIEHLHRIFHCLEQYNIAVSHACRT